MRHTTLERGALLEVTVAARALARAEQRLQDVWVRLYEEGVPSTRLAVASGVSPNAVRHLLAVRGVPRRFKNTGEYRVG